MAEPRQDIPRQLSNEEATAFLQAYRANAVLKNYLSSRQPAHGVIVRTPAPFLVWFDAAGLLHVIDLSPMSDAAQVAAQIEKPPYQQAEESVLYNITQNIQAAANKIPSGEETAGILTGLLVVAGLFIGWKILGEITGHKSLT
jgi:hypothetical protein